jgi:hypothetical protein
LKDGEIWTTSKLVMNDIFLNTFKFDSNQCKINHKPTFERLGQSDISKVFHTDDTFTFWIDILDLSGGDSEKKNG